MKFPQTFIKKTSITQHVSFITFLVSCIIFFIFLLNNFQYSAMASLYSIVGFFIPVILHSKKHSLFAKYTFLLVANSSLFLQAIILGKVSGAHLILVPFCSLPLMLFQHKELFKITFFSIMPVAIAFILELLDYQLFFEHPQETFILTKIIHGVAFSTAFILSLFFVFIWYRSQKHYVDTLDHKNKTLKDTLDKLQKSNEIAEELSNHAAYAQLTRGIAHEIKNPLQMIYGRSEMVLQNLNDTKNIKKFASITSKNILRLNNLIKAMNRYGTHSNTVQNLFHLETLINDIKELSGHRCKQSNIQINITSQENFFIIANEDAIYQALLNLIINAIQHSYSGGKIEIHCISENYLNKAGEKIKGVKIAIQDFGTGIKKSHLNKIFSPYFTTKKDKENVGLGLAITHKTLMENNGALRVVSKEKLGSTFFVYLPTTEKQHSYEF